MRINVSVPGSCGELVQGFWEGKSFLVTCPIDLYVTVAVTDEHQEFVGLGKKSMYAAELALQKLGQREFPYGLELGSSLPNGKGMGSSSADIAAVMLAISTAFGRAFSMQEISDLAAQIEPTDGTFFSGIVRMNPLTGQCFEHWTEIPAMPIAIFDTGGTVDTIEFHKRCDLRLLDAAKATEIYRAMRLLEEPLLTADRIAEAATISALANQFILPKDGLADILTAAKAAGALGLDVAHSGTVIGILFAPGSPEASIDAAIRQLSAKFPYLSYLRTAHLVPGGFQIAEQGGTA